MSRRTRWRGAVVALALAGRLMVALALPLPTTVGAAKDAGTPYPCQHRPCGCLDAKQCWAGDCCCFTLAEKLAWADAQGFEPPPHVRPLVQSRPPCGSPCRSSAEPESCCHESDDVPAGVRWVVGTFAQRCRGDGPANLAELDPAVTSPTFRGPSAVRRVGSLVTAGQIPEGEPQSPPVPPPRHV